MGGMALNHYTVENLDSFGVWFLNGPDSYAYYNFVREDHPCVRLMREIVPGGLFESVNAPISTDRGDVRWLKVPKAAFDTALISIRAVATSLRRHPS